MSMKSTSAVTQPQMPEPLAGPAVGSVRLGTGLLQGFVLYLLYRAGHDYNTWPATEPLLFAPLLMVALLVPVIVISSLGHLNGRQLLIWAGTSAAIIAALAFYDIWRVSDAAVPVPSVGAAGRAQPTMPSEPLGAVLLVGFFIAHSMAMAGIRDRRVIASYQSHFEIAWKHVIQLAFSAAFVGVVWLVLGLGSELFLLVKLDFLQELIHKPWFMIPVIAFAFSCAMHLTDVRPAIVQGIRTLLLVLMSWVLPVITLIVGAFILSLPFTGLASLWATGHATTVLLGAAATFVVLINAAWQDGTAGSPVAPVVKASARAASLLLVPIVAIAAHALSLRVGDYGWTADRIIAAACLLVASCSALGYGAAALRGGWLGALQTVNVGTAFVVLATLLMLFSPVADPARLSVIDQVARLASGKMAADKFDFAYLRFEGARYGRDALARLDATATGKDGGVVRERIAAARKMRGPWDHEVAVLSPHAAAANLSVWPKGASLPASFLQSDWNGVRQAPLLPTCLRRAGKTCDAYLFDMNGDGKPEVILVGTTPDVGSAVLAENARGEWHPVGFPPYFLAGCESVRKNLISGNFRLAAPVLPDLDVSGVRVQVNTAGDVTNDCPPRSPPVPPRQR
jgi:hypothetical protein